MQTPIAALAWQLWRKHRGRLTAIAGIVLAFILVYPKLCALAGFNLESRGASNELARLLATDVGQPTLFLFHMVRVLYLIVLAWSPAIAMIVTLLYVTWVFTFTDFDPKATDPLSFPSRLFTLPISTSFLFWRLLLGGLVAIFVLCTIWVRCVRIPNLEDFTGCGNCFIWMTLLVLVQAIVWALAAWPITRMLALFTVFFLFVASPARRDIIESPIFLLPVFLAGAIVAHLGLKKMRHGQWQGWFWKQPFANRAARANLRGPKRFASPAQAQLWFEWRQSAGRMCLFTLALALVPVVIQLVCVVAGHGSLNNDTMGVFIVYLAFMPLIIYFIFAIEPNRRDLPFLLVRPLTSGEMVMAKLKAAACSTVLSWVAVLMALAVMPLLGDINAVAQQMPLIDLRVAVVIGLIGMVFLTWRTAVIYFCFTLTGDKRIAAIPGLILYPQIIGVVALFASRDTVLQSVWFWNHLPQLLACLLACLLAAKFLLAFRAFRTSFTRGLLPRSALVGYLVVWGLLVSALLATLLFLVRPPDKALILPVSLCIVLLVPLARIGFSVLAFEWGRHT